MTNPMPSPLLSHCSLLGAAGLIGGGLMAASLLTACGGDSDSAAEVPRRHTVG